MVKTVSWGNLLLFSPTVRSHVSQTLTTFCLRGREPWLGRSLPAEHHSTNWRSSYWERLHADVQRRDQCARKDQPCKVLREEFLAPGILKFCIYLKTNHARGNKLETVIARRSSSPHHCFVHRSDTHAYTSSPHGCFQALRKQQTNHVSRT